MARLITQSRQLIMRLFELFSSGGDMMTQLRQDALNVITPYLGQKVPFVTVNQVIDGLRSSSNTGIMIDRSLVTELLNPDEVKAVEKIQGNRIYLSNPDSSEDIDAEDEQKNMDQVSNMAKDQAKKQTQS